MERVNEIVSSSESDSLVDLEMGDDAVEDEKARRMLTMMRAKKCRMCHDGLQCEEDRFFDLGCSCKGRLSVAHEHCANRWFTLKGNTTCEICGSIARNVHIEESQLAGQTSEAQDAPSPPPPPQAQPIWQSRSFVHFMIVCVHLVIIIGWMYYYTFSAL